MSGLLGGVLPAIYSQADRAKRYLGGLLSDPVGRMQQAGGQAVDDLNKIGLLSEQAFSDPRNPMKMQDNAASRQLVDTYLNSVLNFAPVGMNVWHGSPHKFDRFDSSKIGTGEGAQAYGHGLYLAESPEVSKTYMRTQMGNAPELEQMALRAGASKDAANTVAQWYHQTKDAKGLDKFLQAMREPAPSPYIQKFRDSVVKEEPALRKAWESFTDPGQLYKVDLPDDAIAKMLDWDKPLSQQAPEVRSAWDKFLSSKAGKKYAQQLGGASNLTKSATGGELTGESLMKNLMGANEAKENYRALASDYLRNQGIPGIRYLDGGSRGAGSGSSNFVVFPGNESLLTILERNGQPIR